MISFDTETRGLDWWQDDEQAFLASWADARNEYTMPLLAGEDQAKYAALAKAEHIHIAHNLKFDVHQIRETTGYDMLSNGHELHDTDLMSRVLHPEGQRKGSRGGHGLKELATVYLRADAKHAEEAIEAMAHALGHRTLRKKGVYYEVWRAYPDVMEHYAAMDARYTYDLFERFARELTEDDRARRIYELEIAVTPTLIRAEQTGIAVDPPAVDALWAEWEPIERDLHAYLEDTLGEGSFEGDGSEDKLRESLLKAGVPLYRKTDTGLLATNKFALQEFAETHEVVGKLMEWRTAKRFLDTYIGPMREREVVHTNFNQCEAWTGRMSSRRPNMQNIPKRAGKEVRAMFVPRPGHAFVVCDYDAIEARLLAYYLGDKDFQQKLNEGFDMHAWMASVIWGGSPEQYAKGGPNDKLRSLAKNILFAITYGAGGPRVGDMLLDAKLDNVLGMDADERKNYAKSAVISKIKAALPNYYRLQKRIKNKIENVGYVNTAYGRKQVVNKDKAYVGLNALIQGTAADVMKQGVINVTEATADLGSQVLLLVHDEIVQEVPLDAAKECLNRTTEAMCSAAHPGMFPDLAVTGSIVTTNYADA